MATEAKASSDGADPNDEIEPTELVLFQVPECYVYLIPPRKSAASYRADEWNVNKWAWDGTLKVISKGEECIIKLEDRATGELYARAFLRKGEPHPMETVIDSSRYFVLRIEENIDGRARHAFIGLGFRERTEAYDFQAALHDHMKYLNKKKTAEEMEQHYQNASSVDYSIKEGEKLVLNLKNLKTGGAVKSKFFQQDQSNQSPESKGDGKEPAISIKPPPPPPSPVSPVVSPTTSPSKLKPDGAGSPSKLKPDEAVLKEPAAHEKQRAEEAADDDFGDFQGAMEKGK